MQGLAASAAVVGQVVDDAGDFGGEIAALFQLFDDALALVVAAFGACVGFVVDDAGEFRREVAAQV